MTLAIKPVLWLLAGKKEMCNIGPQRIAGKSDKEIRIVVFPCNVYCILKRSCRYPGVSTKDGGRMTWRYHVRKLPVKVLLGLVLDNSHVFLEFEDSNESVCIQISVLH